MRTGKTPESYSTGKRAAVNVCVENDSERVTATGNATRSVIRNNVPDYNPPQLTEYAVAASFFLIVVECRV